MLLTSFLIVTSFTLPVNVKAQGSSLGTYCKVEPANVTMGPKPSVGQQFTTEVNLYNVTHTNVPKGLLAVEIKLRWNNTLLKYVSREKMVGQPGGVLNSPTFEAKDTNETNYYWLASVSMGSPWWGNGTIVKLTFQVISQPEEPEPKASCLLEIFYCEIDDASTPPRMIFPVVEHGYYEVLPIPMAPTPDFSITAFPTSFTTQQGSSDTSVITITSINGFNQPVQLTVSGAPSGVTTVLNHEQVTPPPDGSAPSTLTVSVATTATPGSYTLTVTGTNGTITHSLDISLEITAHDIAVKSVILLKKVIGQGYTSLVIITFENQGSYAETFNVTLYANTALICTFTNLSLMNGNSTTITFTWNTTGFAKGNYTISAYATPIPGETDTDDNRFTDGVVTVTIAGDLDGNLAVQLVDLVILAKAYGSRPGEPGWNPNADLDDNGNIALTDLIILTKNYGKVDP